MRKGRERESWTTSPAVLQGFPSTSMETPADPELYRGGECPFQQLIQREAQHVSLEERLAAGHHGQHHCQHEHWQSECTAVAKQPPPVLKLHPAVIGPQRSAVTANPASFLACHTHPPAGFACNRTLVQCRQVCLRPPMYEDSIELLDTRT